MASIHDIAKKAGVSVSTVSRALNNYQDVNPKTREKIIEIAKELNYYPSAVARGLVMKRTQTIGLFFGDHMNSGFDHPFFMDVISAVREEAGDAGYDLLIFTNKHKERATYATLCRERGVDGVFLILTGGGKKKNDQLIELQESGIPCVAIDLPLEGERCTYVESNNFLGAKKAVLHLIELGHRNIAFIGGDEIAKTSFDRLNGYRAALSESGIDLNASYIEMAYFSEELAKEATKKILARNKDVTAFFAISDLMAFAVIETLQEHALRVPEDISVIGFDDIKEASTFEPPLTTISQQKYAMGRAATNQLMKSIEDINYRPSPITLPTELVIRKTTDYIMR